MLSSAAVVSTLLHEMVHLWQHVLGEKPPKRAYHNKEWAAKMQRVGLMPSNTGGVGDKMTGAQMTHYIIADGPFQQAFAALAASGWKLNLESAMRPGELRRPVSKVKFTCPACGANVWGKPDVLVACIPCEQKMLAVGVASYEQQVA